MITLTAQMRIQGENPLPFRVGETPLVRGTPLGNGALFGETIDVEAVFDRRNLLSLESEIRDRSDIKLPSWGIFSNGGNLSFKDINSRFLGYANAGLLKSGIKVEIFLNDTISKRKEIVGTYYTADWEYDNDNLSVSVSLKDDLEEWQSIKIDGINYDPRNPKSVFSNMAELYKWLSNHTPKKYKMFTFDDLEYDLQSFLESTVIEYPLLNEGSLWEGWSKLCVVCGLVIFKDFDNYTVCKKH